MSLNEIRERWWQVYCAAITGLSTRLPVNSHFSSKEMHFKL